MIRPTAYAYDADEHCESCTEARFGRCACGDVACPGGHEGATVQAEDSEGNPVGACFEPHSCGLWCGTCGEEIVEPDHSHLEPGEQCDECGHVEPVEGVE